MVLLSFRRYPPHLPRLVALTRGVVSMPTRLENRKKKKLKLNEELKKDIELN